MIGTLQCVILDCPDPPGLAQFYQALLGGTVNQADPRWSVHDDFATLHSETGLVPFCLLQGRRRGPVAQS